MRPFQTESFEEDVTEPKGKTSESRIKNKKDPITPKGLKFKFTIEKGKCQGESSTQETQVHDEFEGEEEENESEQEEEEEPENEQKQEEGEFDEEGLPKIPSTSQSQETHEGVPPTSCDILGTTSVSFTDTIHLGSIVLFSSQAPKIHVIPSTSTSESALDTPHDNLDIIFLPNLSEAISSTLEDLENFMSETQIPPWVSTISNPPTIVTTSIQLQELTTTVLTIGVDEDSSLPPW